MGEKIPKYITQWLIEKNVIAVQEFDVYQYGVFLLLTTIVDIVTILTLAIIFDELQSIICFLISFIELRRYAGGYHANSIWGCYFATVVVSMIVILCIKCLEIPFLILLVIGGFVGVIIVSLAPVSSKNKRLDEVEHVIYRKRVRYFWGAECIVLFLMEIFGFRKCFEGVLAGQCCVALALYLEVILAKRSEGELDR
jgi:accessory gene regulator B